MEKYGSARLATLENIAAHGLFMLDYKGFKHTLIIYHIFCFSTVTMVT